MTEIKKLGQVPALSLIHIYSRRIFQEIKKVLRIKRHEHFWDAYHVNEELKRFLKPYPSTLLDLAFKAIKNHQKSLLQTVLDLSLIHI